MNRKLIIIAIAIVLVLIVIGGGLFFFFSNNGAQKETQTSTTEKGIVDCGNLVENASCFLNRMNTCLPVTGKLTGTDGSNIEIAILGYENETCHFQRKLNNVASLDCYFPKGTPLTSDLIDQTFGNDKGLQKVVDNSCGLR
jgi:uncharacterized protein YpmB